LTIDNFFTFVFFGFYITPGVFKENKMRKIHKYQHIILNYLAKKTEPILLENMVSDLSVDQIFISSHSQTLGEMGFLNVSEKEYIKVKLKDESVAKNGLPERIIINCLNDNGGKVSIKDVPQCTDLSQKEVGITLKVLSKKAWVENQRGVLVLSDIGKEALCSKGPDEKLVEELTPEYKALDSVVGEYSGEGFSMLRARKNIIAFKESKYKFFSLSAEGKKLLEEGISP